MVFAHILFAKSLLTPNNCVAKADELVVRNSLEWIDVYLMMTTGRCGAFICALFIWSSVCHKRNIKKLELVDKTVENFDDAIAQMKL